MDPAVFCKAPLVREAYGPSLQGPVSPVSASTASACLLQRFFLQVWEYGVSLRCKNGNAFWRLKWESWFHLGLCGNDVTAQVVVTVTFRGELPSKCCLCWNTSLHLVHSLWIYAVLSSIYGGMKCYLRKSLISQDFNVWYISMNLLQIIAYGIIA